MIHENDTRETYKVEVMVKYLVEVPKDYTLTGTEKLFSDNTRLINNNFSLISDNLQVDKVEIVGH